MVSNKVSKFLVWEAASRDTIDFKRCYVDICDDLLAGLFLCQALYWFLPDRQGKAKTTIYKDGVYWIRKNRNDWYEECRISPTQYDRVIKIVRQKGFGQTKIFKSINCHKAETHLSLNISNIVDALALVFNNQGDRFNQSLVKDTVVSKSHPQKKVDTNKLDGSYLRKLKGIRKSVFDKVKSEFPPDDFIVRNDKEFRLYLFAAFWNIYNYRTNKARAISAFNKLPFKDIPLVLDHCKLYVSETALKSDKDKNKPFRAHASTYLNNKRWEDEIIVDDKGNVVEDDVDIFGENGITNG